MLRLRRPREKKEDETTLMRHLAQDGVLLEEFLSKVVQKNRFLEKLVILVNTRVPVTLPYDVYTDYTPLGYAIINNDPASVDVLLRHGACARTAPCTYVDDAVKVQSPLHLALLRQSDAAIVDSLMKHGACTAQIQRQDVSSLLHFIVKCPSETTAAALLADMSNLNSTDGDRRTLLHLAALNGNDAVARIALQTRQVDVDKVDALGKTALIYAAKRNSPVFVQILLDGGATVDLADAWNRTALHFAVRRADLRIVELLLSSGADVEIEDHKGLTPLNYAFSGDNILHRREPKEDSHDLLQSMLKSTKKRVSLYKQDFLNVAFLVARTCENESVVIKLLEDNPSHVSQRNDDGQMLIHVAAEFSKHRVVKWLIEKGGVDADTTDAIGWLPLHYAAKGGNSETFFYLLDQHGADVNSATPSGWTPLWILSRNGWTDLACDVIRNGCDVQRTMSVSALRQADSHFGLPLSLFDPEAQRAKPVEYARTGSRRITLLEFASKCELTVLFRVLSEEIAAVKHQNETYNNKPSKRVAGDAVASDILAVATRAVVANGQCQPHSPRLMCRTVYSRAIRAL
ncbi:hypothetical protein NP493_716g01003 [Ridgeia piscesae]|uniref:Ankyrin repeat n=1 Tax=Ridgeia piscesae TaxID=27915 RepID=A0AAD9NMF1_RIDPI|nr:hypothetical protein NP493_716g01003 [Ridgeia piscesae]